MTIQPVNSPDNPQQPYTRQDMFIPDQLIAGNLKVVSDNDAIIAGSAPLVRGTVMGRSNFGAITGTAGNAFANGTIVVTTAGPAAGDTLTIQGTAITFQNQVSNVDPPPATVYIGSSSAVTAQNLQNFLENSTDTNLSKLTYSLSGSTITATAAIPGTAGNAYTLATSDSSAFTLSGATLSGGTANTGNATLSAMTAGPATKSGNYVATCLTATTAQVVDPNGDEIGVATFGTAFTDAQINFTITAGGTPCVAGDKFVFTAAPTAGSVYKLCQAGATDGSNVPAGILADYADPSGGNVRGGIYIMGEFNAQKVIIDPSISLATAIAMLKNRSIFLKNTVSADDPS